MRVLVLCECSGIVREAFRAKGHEAYSCDLLSAEDGSPFHIQGDALEVIRGGQWDLIIMHPPCDHLAVSGSRWFPVKIADGRQAEAIKFFMDLVWLATKAGAKWALENPIGIMSKKYRKPEQIIQPWQHGHGEVKATCLWLKGLPKLRPTNIVPGREAKVHRMAPGPNRKTGRSRTYTGIAKAMAEQWG